VPAVCHNHLQQQSPNRVKLPGGEAGRSLVRICLIDLEPGWKLVEGIQRSRGVQEVPSRPPQVPSGPTPSCLVVSSRNTAHHRIYWTLAADAGNTLNFLLQYLEGFPSTFPQYYSPVLLPQYFSPVLFPSTIPQCCLPSTLFAMQGTMTKPAIA
jgi:hypothetical protein